MVLPLMLMPVPAVSRLLPCTQVTLPLPSVTKKRLLVPDARNSTVASILVLWAILLRKRRAKRKEREVMPFSWLDGFKASFDVDVPKDGEVKVRYRVRIKY